MVSKVKELMERDARCTVRNIARMVCLSLSSAHYIQKINILNVRKISAREKPHLLTSGQMKQKDNKKKKNKKTTTTTKKKTNAQNSSRI